MRHGMVGLIGIVNFWLISYDAFILSRVNNVILLLLLPPTPIHPTVQPIKLFIMSWILMNRVCRCVVVDTHELHFTFLLTLRRNKPHGPPQPSQLRAQYTLTPCVLCITHFNTIQAFERISITKSFNLLLSTKPVVRTSMTFSRIFLVSRTSSKTYLG